MAKPKDEQTQLPTHGAAVLPSVKVDSYNLEVEDEEGFVGDEPTRVRSGSYSTSGASR